MTEGVVGTKGTRLYFAVDGSDILKVACATGIQGLGGAGTQIPLGCLEAEEEEFFRGRKQPGTVTIPIVLIPRSASHHALLDLDESGDTISWMIVLSDQANAPTALDSEGRLQSPGATSVEFLGYVADMDLNIDDNQVVRGTLTIQRSGAKFWDLPAADLA
jgi:hypothetical protein